MKPLLSGMQDIDKLQDLGRASIQIVHDLKNQLNGLKLYATFLRKRFEKSDRPPDEQETVTKLIAGLERAAADLSTIVQYGRPLELKKQPGVDIQKVMRNACSSLNEGGHGTGSLAGSIIIESEPAVLCGEYDPTMLADAFKCISQGALKLSRHQTEPQTIIVRFTRESGEVPTAVVEWLGINHPDHDPFRSFAGSYEIRMSLAAKAIEAHGGSATCENGLLRVKLPLSD
jgi:light-regulated signal transduction histidine kinase (bacteriophytochrome)